MDETVSEDDAEKNEDDSEKIEDTPTPSSEEDGEQPAVVPAWNDDSGVVEAL